MGSNDIKISLKMKKHWLVEYGNKYKMSKKKV